MKKKLVYVFLGMFIVFPVMETGCSEKPQPPLTTGAHDWPQFRGPNRDGVSKEKGLLQSWPKEGPKLLWTYANAGMGFSSHAIVGDILYTMGGLNHGDYVIAIDLKKPQELWRTKVGKLFVASYGAGPRCTPTVDGNFLYALGGNGDLVCLDRSKKGEVVWRKNFAKDFGGEMMSEWGYSESVLIDGDKLICTPGGNRGTLLALKKATGDVIWQSKEVTNLAPFSSVMVHEVNGQRTYVQTSYIDENEGGIISGFAAETGKLLWSQNLFKRHSYAIAPNPIIVGNLVYHTAGYGGGCHLFEITAAGGKLKAKDLYAKSAQKNVKNTHGGVVLIGDHLYGHSETQMWLCQDLKTGQIKWSERARLSCRSGSITAADNRLYLYSDDGEATLLVPNPEKWEEVGNFTIPQKAPRAKLTQGAGVWTHPVIANGRLYLRDQELIFCFDVKK